MNKSFVSFTERRQRRAKIGMDFGVVWSERQCMAIHGHGVVVFFFAEKQISKVREGLWNARIGARGRLVKLFGVLGLASLHHDGAQIGHRLGIVGANPQRFAVMSFRPLKLTAV